MKYLTRDKKVGDILNGVTLASDDVLYVASGTPGEVRKLRSAMSASDEELVLNVVKEIQYSELEASHEENLLTAFEYPIASGNTFSIQSKYMAEFNALALYNGTFVYPFSYRGNGNSIITCANPAELAAFHGAGLTQYETLRATLYEPKISQVNAITINLPTVTMEQAITQVQAIFY